MQLIYILLTVLLVLTNLAGLTSIAMRLVPSAALARGASVLLFSANLFFVEHFFGLGQLHWLWPLTTVLAVFALLDNWRRGNLPVLLAGEAVFIAAFVYGFIWKWFFPDIYPSSERITDLYFIGNYLPGRTLPPLDHWFPPLHFDFYYAFQHYAAALMGRIFAMGPGLSYNIAFPLLMAMTIALAWDFSGRWLDQPWKRLLLVLSFAIGGTGASPFVHLAYQPKPNAEIIGAVNNRMWASQRFVGSIDQIQNTSIGEKLFAADKTSGKEILELPLEDFGYQFYVGDYHPPLGGFFLLLLALSCIGGLEGRASQASSESRVRQKAVQLIGNQPEQFLLQALLVFTVPMTITTNTWVFPLQAILVLSWMAWRWLNGNPPDLRAVIIGGGLGFLLIYPFLQSFAGNAVPTPIKLVQGDLHSPLLQFLALHWPLLMLALIGLFLPSQRRIAALFALVFLGLLLISEFVYIDDPTGGRYERTNTVMKWWGWLWSGALISLATLLLASSRTWVRGSVIAMLLAINFYAIDVVRYWLYSDLAGAGHVLGDNVYTREAGVKEIFAYLRNAPDGIVLENNYGGAFTDSTVYAGFAVKPSLQGWTMHLETWHQTIPRVWIMDGQVIQFYKANMLNAEEWLLSNRVRYIVWNAKDAAQANVWQTIDERIRNHYAWLQFQADAGQKMGLWVLRDEAL